MDWVIGDIHGEYATLKRLITRIRNFDKDARIYCIGDITGRGADSLSVAQWIMDEGIPLVLGNHDIALLMLYATNGEPKKKDRLSKLIEHDCFEAYCLYLCEQPLMRSIQKEYLLVHAGINPNWTESYLYTLGDQYNSLSMKEKINLFARYRTHSDSELIDNIRFCTNVRYVHRKTYDPDFDEKGSWPSNKKLVPWYFCKRKISKRVIFGHWAALGLYANHNVMCIDGGVVWGNQLIGVGINKNNSAVLFSEPRQH